MGLTINEGKTKLMIVSRTQVAQKRIGPVLDLGSYKFEVVNRFTYLGSVITSDNNETMEIKQRLGIANKAYFGVARLLSSRDLSRATKTTIYKTLIRPIMTYGSEGWTLKTKDAERLGRFERKILRRIYGPIKINEYGYRRRKNSEIYQIKRHGSVFAKFA